MIFSLPYCIAFAVTVALPAWWLGYLALLARTDETGNVEVLAWGTKRQFNFAPKEHADLGPALHVTAVDAYTGERCVISEAAGVPVHRAAAASSSSVMVRSTAEIVTIT